MKSLLVLLLLFLCVGSIVSLPAARETGEKQERSILIEKLLKSPSEEKLTKQLKKYASEKSVDLFEAQPNLRSCSGYGPYGCYAPDCNNVCRAFGYYKGECVSGGCYCVYYDYYEYY